MSSALVLNRVRELESMCAEKDRECEAHRAKYVCCRTNSNVMWASS
jgi:hypothetical protein